MRVVIDVGCADYGAGNGGDSVTPLIERYHPDLFLGFDPQAEERAYLADERTHWSNRFTQVVISAAAAWTRGGTVAFDSGGATAGVPRGGEVFARYPCFDLAALLWALPHSAEKIVKVDIEGGEYPLLAHLEDAGAIELVNKFLVEWHSELYSKGHDRARGRAHYEARYGRKFEREPHGLCRDYSAAAAT